MERSPAANEAVFASVIDSLTEQIAVIDADGAMIAMNAAWRRFAAENRAAAPALVATGANYFDVCAGAGNSTLAQEAAAALAGIRSVLSGAAPKFMMEYRCHSAAQPCWFALRVLPLRGADKGAVLIHRDITDRRVAEQRLQESESRFRSLTEMSSDFYWESDAGHRITLRSADRDAYAPWDFWASAHIGKRRWEMPYLSPDEAGWAAHRAVLDAHLPFRNFELSRTGPDGVEYFRSVSGDPVFDASGAFKGYRGIGRDITGRKRADKALHLADQRLQEAVRASAIGIFDHEHDADTIYWSPRLREHYGYAPDEPVTLQRIVAQVFPEDRERIAEAVRRAHDPAGDGRFDVEHRIVHRSGEIRWMTTRSQTYFGGAGKERRPARTIGAVLDTTERKRVEQDMHAAEEQFRGLVEQSIAGIYILQDGKFAYVNPRLAEILGYASAEDLLGSDPMSIVAEKDRDLVSENMRLPAVGRTGYSFTAVRRDGALIEVGVHGARATHQGRPAIIGLMQDISEKKRAEEQIQRYIRELRAAFMSTVEVATSLSEMRDPYTAGHERRVGTIAASIGAELGLDEQRIEGLRVSGYLHDIGKITIPAEILSKPGKLGLIEYELIKAHPQSSYDVLKNVEFPWPVAEVALQHHERMDGSGYPRGLKGEEILLDARIMAVADVVEAMSSHRPYRAEVGLDAALAEIERGRDSSFDPAVADACLRLFREKGYLVPG